MIFKKSLCKNTYRELCKGSLLKNNFFFQIRKSSFTTSLNQNKIANSQIPTPKLYLQPIETPRTHTELIQNCKVKISKNDHSNLPKFRKSPHTNFSYTQNTKTHKILNHLTGFKVTSKFDSQNSINNIQLPKNRISN